MLSPSFNSVQPIRVFKSANNEVVFLLGVMNVEQKNIAIKFCVKLGELNVMFAKLKQAYEEHSLSQVQVFRWHK